MSFSLLQLHASESTILPCSDATRLEDVMRNAGFACGRWQVSSLSGGTSNVLYKCELIGDSDFASCSIVVKLFGAWTTTRSNPVFGSCVNRVASELRIAPRVYFAGAQGICQECLQGIILDESEFVRSPIRLLGDIALMLATLHSTKIPAEFSDAPCRDAVLLVQFRNMLNYMKTMPERPLPVGVSFGNLEGAYAELEQTLLGMNLPLELCHADVKAANIIRLECADDATSAQRLCLVDFDLSGPSYRGYDLYKPASYIDDISTRHEFLRLYLHARASGESIEALMHEVQMFETVAQLETTIVHCIEYMVDPSVAMEAKAQADWRRLQNARCHFHEHCSALASLATVRRNVALAA